MKTKISALKTSSNVISIIAKIGYSVMSVMICISIVMLIFLGVTGGKTSKFTIGETNIIIFDNIASTPAELAAICAVLIVIGSIFYTILLLAYRMFHEISITGDPFTEKYVKSVKTIGILTAIMPFAAGLATFVTTLFSETEMPVMFSDIPGIVIGAIIFCLSYIIDYGCGLKNNIAPKSDEKA